MASPNNIEMDDTNLGPSEDRAPPVTVQRDGSLDFPVYPRPQDNPQTQDTDKGVTSTEGSNILPGLSFPRKLWKIVQEKAFSSVCWSDSGETVIIDKDLFQKEVLGRKGAEKIFESDSLKTFIRLMNLYGFSKIRPSNSLVCCPGNKTLMIYHNPNFQRDRPWLIKNIKRKNNWMTTEAWPETSATPPKRKEKQDIFPRHSQINYMEYIREIQHQTEKTAPSAHGPSGLWSFQLSGLQSMSGAMIAHCPNDPGVPKGESTSRNGPFATRVPAGTNGTGDRAISPRNLVMRLYNTCYSILMACFSIISSAVHPDEDEDGFSDHLNVFCEHRKADPEP